MERHHRRLYRIALAYVRDPDDALDVVQETFVKAYRNAARWDGASEVTPWLTRIAVNQSIDRYRRGAPSARAGGATGAGRMSTTGAGPPTSRPPSGGCWAARSASASTPRCVALPERQRAVFVLRHYRTWRWRRSRGALDMRLGTVKSGLHRAVERLRERLSAVAR